MMSESLFHFYYWLMFIWGGIGVLFISFLAIREVIMVFKKNKKSNLTNTHDQ